MIPKKDVLSQTKTALQACLKTEKHTPEELKELLDILFLVDSFKDDIKEQAFEVVDQIEGYRGVNPKLKEVWQKTKYDEINSKIGGKLYDAPKPKTVAKIKKEVSQETFRQVLDFIDTSYSKSSIVKIENKVVDKS